MASKRRLRRRQCERKQAYSKDQAFRIAVKLRNGQAPGRRAVDAYQCPLCGQWHVGHRPQKTQFSISDRKRNAEKQA